MCVCTESGSLVVLYTQQYRLLLNKYGLCMSPLENWTLGYEHTHRVIVYICIYEGQEPAKDLNTN